MTTATTPAPSLFDPLTYAPNAARESPQIGHSSQKRAHCKSAQSSVSFTCAIERQLPPGAHRQRDELDGKRAETPQTATVHSDR